MTALNQETKIGVLNDHYKDTNIKIEKIIKNRDRSFLFILILLGVMAFQLFSPQQSDTVLTQVVQNKLNVDASLSINFIGSLIWFGLLAVAIRYFQSVINLEKQYGYVHDLEKEIAKDFGGKAFSREGKSYLKDYPLFSDWLHIIYWVIFPLLLLVGVTAKIISEWRVNNPAWLPLTLDSVIYAVLVISTGLYLLNIHFKK